MDKNNTQNKNQKLRTKNPQDLAALLSELQTQENETPPPAAPTPVDRRNAYNEFRNNTYNIVSIVAYLIGVDKDRFGTSDTAPFLTSVYEKLNAEKDARIIRNLCRIRTAIEKNYFAISKAFREKISNIGSIPELVPTESVTELEQDGVRIYKSRPDVDEYLITVNSEMSNRIGKASGLFPEWIKWDYIKPLFIMNGGTKKEKLKAIGEFYNSDRNRYPYQCWINWDAISNSSNNHGNILYCDEKFVTLLYEHNEDVFENLSLVRDAGNSTMRNLSNLLERCKKCVIVVDCENSDAVKLAAALSSLPSDQLDKISKVLLFDSEYTTDQWKTLVDRSLRLAADRALELEHIVVQRLNQSKSQVDMMLAVRTSKEVYLHSNDAVILVSSDSDYWAMIQQLDVARFLVMLERRKTGLAIMDTLALHDIPFCFIDDFCTGASYSIKTSTLIDGIQTEIDRILAGESNEELNVKTIMENTLQASWIMMTDKEKEAFYKRYLLNMKLAVDANGKVAVTIPDR